MALNSVLYELRCDRCTILYDTQSNQFKLIDAALRDNWKLRRRQDGQIAKSGGKDYCPNCTPAAWLTDSTVPQ